MKLSNQFHKMVREEMKKHRKKKHWNKQDVELIVEAKETGDWSKVYESKFYNEFGGEFCSMLEVLHSLNRNI